MAIRASTSILLGPVLDEIAQSLSRYGVRAGSASGAKASIRIELERNVERIVQVYWTPFLVTVPDECIGLHLEIAEPRVHWTECYLSTKARNWVLTFRERADGDPELAYYEQYASWREALEGFFVLSGWYCLTPTDTQWSDVVYEVGEGISWSEQRELMASASVGPAVQESLKKSTIIWLRWRHEGREYQMPVWYIQHQDKIYVLSGERQQTLPGAEQMRECDVIVRWKGKNAQVAELNASVRVLEPGSEWDEIAERLAEKRLNIPGLPEDTARRWRDECVILELTLRT